MNIKIIAFLEDLADVIEKHQGGLVYTTRDDGIYVTVGDNYDKVNIGYPHNGDHEIHSLLKYLRLVEDE